MHRFLIGVL
nr:unnamed protein product [Callosobruchus chinensis]